MLENFLHHVYFHSHFEDRKYRLSLYQYEVHLNPSKTTVTIARPLHHPREALGVYPPRYQGQLVHCTVSKVLVFDCSV